MRTRWVIAVGLTLVGLVWLGQGLGILRGSSFMVGDTRWAIAGAVAVVVGFVLGWLTVRGRPRA